MSYPWWAFRVTFADGMTKEYVATGVTVADAIHELTEWTGQEDSIHKVPAEVLRIEFTGMAEGYEDCMPSDWREKLVAVEEVQRDH